MLPDAIIGLEPLDTDGGVGPTAAKVMIYAFGDCELDSDLHELRVASAVRAIEPQAFDLLLYLIENSDRMVSKDELFEAIWEGVSERHGPCVAVSTAP